MRAQSKERTGFKGKGAVTERQSHYNRVGNFWNVYFDTSNATNMFSANILQRSHFILVHFSRHVSMSKSPDDQNAG